VWCVLTRDLIHTMSPFDSCSQMDEKWKTMPMRSAGMLANPAEVSPAIYPVCIHVEIYMYICIYMYVCIFINK